MSEQTEGKQRGFQFYYGWVIVFCCFLLMGIAFVSAYSVNSVFVKPVTEALDVPRGDFSFYLTISNLATLAIAPFLGIMMGKNAKVTNIVCILVLASAYIAISFATNLWQIYGIAIFRGMGYMGACTMATVVYITNWFGIKGVKHKGIATSIAMMGASVGGFVMLPLISKIIVNYGWRWGYRAMGLMLIVILIPIILSLVSNNPAIRGVAVPRQDEKADAPVPQPTGMTVAEARRTSSLWFLVAAMVCIAFAASGLAGHIVAYFSDLGFTAEQAAKIQSRALLFCIVGQLVIGIVHDKVNARLAVLIGTLCLTIAYVCALSMSVSTKMVFLYIAFYGMGTSVGLLAPPMMISYIFGNRDFGPIVGYTTAANGIGSAIGPLVAGKIFDISGSYQVAWLFIISAAALCTLFFMLASRKKYSDSNAKTLTV